MEKKLILPILLLVLFVGNASLISAPKAEDEEETFDVDAWLKKLGVESEKEEGSTESSSKSDLYGEEGEKTEKSEKNEALEAKAKIMASRLKQLASTLAIVTNATKDASLFNPEFRETILPYVETGEGEKPEEGELESERKAASDLDEVKKGPETEANAKKFFDAVVRVKGATGLQSLIATILDKKTYRIALVSKKHKDVQEKIDEVIEHLVKLKAEIEQYAQDKKEAEESLSEEDRLKQLKAKQFKEATVQAEAAGDDLLKQEKTVQDHTLKFYRQLPPFTEAFKKVFSDPEVKKAIEEKGKKREQEAAKGRDRSDRDYSRSRDWSSDDYDRYRRGYDRSDEATPYEEATPYSPTEQKSETQDAETKEDPKKDPLLRPVRAKTEDDKAKEEAENKAKEAENKLKDAEEKKKLAEASLDALFQNASQILETICGGVKPESSLIDDNLKKHIDSQKKNINSFKNTVEEINKRKPNIAKLAKEEGEAKKDVGEKQKKVEDETKKAEEEKKKKAKESLMSEKELKLEREKKAEEEKKKRDEEKKSEIEKIKGAGNTKSEEKKSEQTPEGKEEGPVLSTSEKAKKFYKIFADNISKILTLCKYGYAELKEKADGRYEVLIKENDGKNELYTTQKALSSSYKTVKDALPQENKEAAEAKEKEFVDKATEDIKKGIAQNVSDIIKVEVVNTPLIKIKREDLSKANTGAKRILQFALTAQNDPLPIAIEAKDLSEKLPETQLAFESKFSEWLQKMLMEHQKERAEKKSGKTNLNNKEVNEILTQYSQELFEEAIDLWKEPAASKKVKKKEKADDSEKDEDSEKKAINALKSAILQYIEPEYEKEWLKQFDIRKFALTPGQKKEKAKDTKLATKLHETYQYALTTFNLNEIDCISALLETLRTKTKCTWTRAEKSPSNVTIIEALWIFGRFKDKTVLEKRRTGVTLQIANPQTADVRTLLWQQIVDNVIASKSPASADDKTPGKVATKVATVAKKDTIETGIKADLSNLGEGSKNFLQKANDAIKTSFAKAALAIKTFFKPSTTDRSLVIFYEIDKNRYYAIFKGLDKVTLDKKNPAPEGVEWKEKE